MTHYVKATTKTYVPKHVAILCHREKKVAHRERGALQQLTGGNWVVLSARRRKNHWSDPAIVAGLTHRTLWEHVRGIAGPGQRLYLVAERGANSWAMMGGWDEVVAGRFNVRPHGAGEFTSIVGGRVKKQRPMPILATPGQDIIGVCHAKGSIRLIHPKNHGIPVEEYRHDDPEEACRSLWNIYRTLFGWWTLADAGPWGDSLGALGWAWFRKAVPKKVVLEHEIEEAAASECSAVFGGRQQCFYFGTVYRGGNAVELGQIAPPAASKAIWKGNLHHVDYSKNYLSIMREARFPIQLAGRLLETNLNKVRQVAELVDIVAHCRINSRRGAIPYRHNGRVIFPLGLFNTTLTTPELVEAIRHREVVEIISGWRYWTGYPLKQFAEQVLKMHSIADYIHCPHGKRFSKVIGNALSGRLGRLETSWVEKDIVDPAKDWGEWISSPGDGSKSFQVRTLAGRSWVKEKSEKRIPGLTAIYAHILAYGRVRLQELIRKAGTRGVIACDTDGAWLTDDGFEEITRAGMLKKSGPGHLRHVASAECGVFRGPQHYWTSKGWILSGFSNGVKIGPNGELEWSQIINPFQTGDISHGAAVAEHRHKSSFSELGSSSSFDSSGWALSVKLSASTLVSIPEVSVPPLLDSADD